ncbi:MAG TPA: toprim domain-containing protein [Candidatus Paceibacterota bacterium]
MQDTITKLAELFQRLPGIGPRQAKRFVHYILQSGRSYSDDLSKTIARLETDVLQCARCQRFYLKNRKEKCELCENPLTPNILLVVEKDADLDNIRRSGSFEGWYFVLGGLIPILEEYPKKHIRLHELDKRIKELPDLQEIVLALSTNTLGDNTIEYLKSRFAKLNIKISVLGRGLSTGAELEYSDANTLSHALTNRK